MYHESGDGKGGGARPSGIVVGRPEILGARPDLVDDWAVADPLFGVQVTRSFWERIDPTDPRDPLALQVLPDRREATADGGDEPDPVGDHARSPVSWVVHKYPDRVLLLVTKRCHLYCRYCFRRTFDPTDAEDPTPAEWAAALDYARRCGAREVILSGGDPLAAPEDRLIEALRELRPHVDLLRIHTRAPITHPARVTPALVAALREYAPLWVVVHCNHPRELSEDVAAALGRLVDAGIPVLNQSVLLAGVNDDVDVLEALCRRLVSLRVTPYYLHHPDAVPGTAHLRVTMERGVEIHRALEDRLSGLAVPRYVIDPPDGSGKVRVERFLEGHRRGDDAARPQRG
jgi:lysine 2,3-aminomutase